MRFASSLRSRMLLVIVGGSAISIALALWFLGDGREKPIHFPPSLAGSEGASSTGVAAINAIPTFDLDPSKLGIEEVCRSVEDALFERLADEFPSSGEVPNHAGLVGAVGDSLSLYLAGRFEDYMKVMETHRGEPISERETEIFRKEWRSGQGVIAMAPLDVVGIRISRGDERYPLPQGVERLDITRPGAGGFDSLSVAGDNLIEVEIPAILRPKGAPRCAGYVGFSYGFEPKTGTWRLVRVSLVREIGPGFLMVPSPP